MSRKTNRVVNAKFTSAPPRITAKSFNQDRLMQAIEHDQVVLAIGSAGTGKTWLSATMAADMWADGDFNRIVVTRPTVPAGEDLGALPGELEEKFGPWVDVVLDPIKQRLARHPGKFEAATRKGGKGPNIEAIPLYLLRGSTFDNTFVILDEAQNATAEQIRMLCTRMGKNSKLVISGDTRQCDLGKNGGLEWFIRTMRQWSPQTEIVEFTIEDCVRSGVCKHFLEIFEKADL